MSVRHKYTFPVRNDNAFEILIDGEQYFPAMLTAIDSAQHFIFLEQYLVITGKIGKQFVNSLSQAVKRGVEVFCLFDDYGSRGLNQYSRQQLVNAGIHLSFYNPVRLKHWQSALFRDHRKLLLVDNATGFVGGAGITDDFIATDGKPGWHDILLKIQGEVLSDWNQLFQHTWQQITDRPITISSKTSLPPTSRQSGQVLINQPWHQEFNRMLLNKMQRASQKIWITTPYFVPNWKLRRRLKRMSKLGVDVRLLLPGQLSDHPWVSQAARRYYTRLLKHNVRIFEYQPRFTHAKIVLCDNWVSIGSSNLDRWNQRWNLDANQAIEDHSIAALTTGIFENDFSQSEEILLSSWLHRSWWQRWRETYAGYVVMLAEKLSRYFPRRRKQ